MFGTEIGGTLALSLGITESIIDVAAVHNPIVNLFSLGAMKWNRNLRQWSPEDRESRLSQLREDVFGADPYRWLDKFASPLFFLRTEHLHIEKGEPIKPLPNPSMRLLLPDIVLRTRFLIGYDKSGEFAKDAADFAGRIRRAWALQVNRAHLQDPKAYGTMYRKDAMKVVSEFMVDIAEIEEGHENGVAEVGKRLGDALRLIDQVKKEEEVEKDENAAL